MAQETVTTHMSIFATRRWVVSDRTGAWQKVEVTFLVAKKCCEL